MGRENTQDLSGVSFYKRVKHCEYGLSTAGTPPEHPVLEGSLLVGLTGVTGCVPMLGGRKGSPHMPTQALQISHFKVNEATQSLPPLKKWQVLNSIRTVTANKNTENKKHMS